MRITKKTEYTLYLDPDEMTALRAGYKTLYPSADDAWFKRQVLANPQRQSELVQWLDASEERFPATKDVCIEVRTKLLHTVEEEDARVSLADEIGPLSQDYIKKAYPRIAQLGMPVWEFKVGTALQFIPRARLQMALAAIDKDFPGFADRFHEFFGVQTMSSYGPYPWDVEAVLERQLSGKLTGTQLIPD